MAEIWGRMPGEGIKAFEAFMTFLMIPPRVRSIARAFRIAKGHDADDLSIPSHPHWEKWSSAFNWQARAKAYDEHVAQKDLALWEERRKKARERDWEQAEALRDLVAEALPTATGFYKRSVRQAQTGTPTIVDAEGKVIQEGTPTVMIQTVAFDVKSLSSVLVDASKLQRLTNNEPTDNVNNLTGAVLDDALEQALRDIALEGIPNRGQASPPQGGPPETGQIDEEEEEG